MPADSIPAVVVPLLVGRSNFAELWHRGQKYGDAHAPALASVMADKGFARSVISASLQGHPDLQLPAEQADRLANDATAARRAVDTGEQWNVTIVRWYRQTPALYELQVGDSMVTATSAHLSARSRLCVRCLDVGVVARLPPASDYQDWLEEQINNAEAIDQPEEAGETGAQAEYVSDQIDAMPYCEAPDRMADGCYYLQEGHRVIRASIMYRARVQVEWPTMTRADYYRHLRNLGWSPHSLRVGDQTLRTGRIPHTGDQPQSAAEQFAQARRRLKERRQQSLDEWGEPDA